MKKIGGIFLSLALLAIAGSAFAQVGLPTGSSTATLYTGTSWCPACQVLEGSSSFSSLKNQLGNKLQVVTVDSSGQISGTGGTPPDFIESYPSLTLQDSSGNILSTVSGQDGIEGALQQLVGSSAGAEEESDNGKSIVVATKYEYVGPGKGQYGPSDELILHGRPLPPGQVISDPKQQELEMNAGTGQGRTVRLGGAEVGAGVYVVGPNCQTNHANPSSTSGVKLPTLDENAFETCTKATSVTPTGTSPGGGGQFGGGAQGGLGANPLLPLLLSGLLSQGMGGFGGQQSQGQPYGDDALSLPVNCAQQQVSPVCGEDGKTYNNSCYMSEARVTLKSQGVCANPSPSPTPNTSAILSQLSASGVPASLLSSITSIVTSILSSILSGVFTVGETAVR